MKNQLLDILNNTSNQDCYRYLLINPLTDVSELNFIHINNIKAHTGDEIITTVNNPDFAYNLDLCPKLITLAKPHQPLNSRFALFSVKQAESELLQTRRYVCGWIVSELPPEVIAAKITNIGVYLSQFFNTKFMPFYEPFRMQLFHQGNQNCPEFMMDMLSGFKHYSYLTTNNTINTIDGLDYQPSGYELFLSDEAKFYQQYFKNIFSLFLTRVNINKQIDQKITDVNLLTLGQSYHNAVRYGLTNTNDQTIFTLMSYQYGDLLSVPILKQAVDDAKLDEGSLNRRFQEIDKHYFLSIKKD